MNEVILNTTEIESVWEKDNVCFVKMKSGKVWLCEQNYGFETTSNYLISKKGLVSLPLSSKGKRE